MRQSKHLLPALLSSVKHTHTPGRGGAAGVEFLCASLLLFRENHRLLRQSKWCRCRPRRHRCCTSLTKQPSGSLLQCATALPLQSAHSLLKGVTVCVGSHNLFTALRCAGATSSIHTDTARSTNELFKAHCTTIYCIALHSYNTEHQEHRNQAWSRRRPSTLEQRVLVSCTSTHLPMNGCSVLHVILY